MKPWSLYSCTIGITTMADCCNYMQFNRKLSMSPVYRLISSSNGRKQLISGNYSNRRDEYSVIFSPIDG